MWVAVFVGLSIWFKSGDVVGQDGVRCSEDEFNGDVEQGIISVAVEVETMTTGHFTEGEHVFDEQ